MKKIIIAGVAVVGVTAIATIIYKKMIKKASVEEIVENNQASDESENVVSVEAETIDTVDTHESRMNHINEDHMTRMKQINETFGNINKILDEIRVEIESGNFDTAQVKLTTFDDLLCSLNNTEGNQSDTHREFKPNTVMLKIIKANPELLEKYPEYKDYI